MAYPHRLTLLVASLSLAACGPKPAPKPTEPPPKTDKPGGPTSVPMALNADAVLSVVQSDHMPGIQRCYKDHLKKDATASGRVVLTLPITADGQVDGGSASGFANEVDACVAGLMKSWRFPRPKDAETFQITLQLVPN